MKRLVQETNEIMKHTFLEKPNYTFLLKSHYDTIVNLNKKKLLTFSPNELKVLKLSCKITGKKKKIRHKMVS
jgi:beta-galactosidase beta subunit